MKTKLLLIAAGAIFLFTNLSELCADELQMQNGERFLGKVLYVSASTVVLDSETLGRISVPRPKVAILTFGTNNLAAASAGSTVHISIPTNLPATLVVPAKTNANLSALLNQPGLNTDFISQIRNQMLGGSPEATSKYDAMVGDLLNGKLDLNGLRRQAQSSVDQINELKRELGPDAGDSLDGYMAILNSFLNEMPNQPAATTNTRQQP